MLEKHDWGFLAAVRACGLNGTVRAACHTHCPQCFPVWLGECPQLLMVSQRWVVCDAHPAQPPLTDPRGDNWLLSSITRLAFQWLSETLRLWRLLLLDCFSPRIPHKEGKGRDFFIFFFVAAILTKRFPAQVWAFENQFELSGVALFWNG